MAEETFIVYSHIGPWSRRLTDSTSEGTLRLRDDLRQGDGLLAAPLGIFLLDCVSKNTHVLALSAPTRIDVHVLEPATDVSGLRIQGRVIRHGRTQIFTEATMHDADDPERVVAYGTVSMSVTGPAGDTPAGYGHEPPPPDEADPPPRPPLTEVFGGVPREDGGYDIPGLRPSIGHGRLHSGVMQVLAEAAAMNAVRRTSGAQHVWTEYLGTTVAASARQGPFSVRPQVLSVRGGSGGCRVEVVDHGADDRTVASLFVRLRLVG